MKYSLVMRYFLISSVFLLGACAAGQGMPMAKYAQADATPQNFKLCHGYSCTARTQAGLSETEWADVLKGFNKVRIDNAKAERVAIAKAVAKMERYVTASSGITPDRAEAAAVRDGTYQMDCIDETVNTDRYLGFLQAAGALQFHEKIEPLHRGFFIDGMWPHNTAAVREIESGAVFAIDSYYHDSGVKIEVVPKAVWIENWSPDER